MDNELKTEKGIQKQKHIMAVALTLFKKYGYDKISVDRIVKESKSSKGSFYQHFPSKSSIFMMRFMEMDKSYENIYSQIKSEYPSAVDRLEAFLLAVYERLENEMGKELMRVIYSAAIFDQDHSFFTNEERKLYIILLEIIEDGQKNETLTEAFPKNEFLQIIVQSMMGTIYYWGLQSDNRSLTDVGTPLVHQLIKSFK